MPTCGYAACNEEVPQLINGLCPKCNMRKWKKGYIHYEAIRERKVCSEPECGLPVKSRGLCQMHYMRMRRTGSTANTRPNGWGAKSKHPMWEAWKSMCRSASAVGGPGMDPVWADFWAYLNDMGNRPAPDARLLRKDPAGPYRKDNCEWRSPVSGTEILAERARVQNEYYHQNKGAISAKRRQKHYGITQEQYAALYDAQGGVCAIHGGPEVVIDGRTGKPFALALDHDKSTGQVRGLLCVGCNTGIGCLSHSIPKLEAAIAYLHRWECEPLAKASESPKQPSDQQHDHDKA